MGQCLATTTTTTHSARDASRRRESSKKGRTQKRTNNNNKKQTKNNLLDVYDIVQQGRDGNSTGQNHLLFHKRNKPNKRKETVVSSSALRSSKEQQEQQSFVPTRLLQRMDSQDGSNHIYAVRCQDQVMADLVQQEQEQPKQQPLPQENNNNNKIASTTTTTVSHIAARKVMVDPSKDNRMIRNENDVYSPSNMATYTSKPVLDWVCVSLQHQVYICDTGLSNAQCDEIVQETEVACRGNYAAYTYAKQTLGCRDHARLAGVCLDVVHAVSTAIHEKFPRPTPLHLDDREPHLVKYDVTRRERQKLDMHTDKSEWTFLIALSDGCGIDYDGGGTYFEALDSTVHVQRGHALIFPGKLRHCGKKITKGLRFLLVGFLVDKAAVSLATTTPTATTTTTTTPGDVAADTVQPQPQ